MTRVFRIAIGSGVLATGLAVAGASTASAQVRVRGSFPTPHGRISVDIGHGAFPVGRHVPYGYDVYEDPYYEGYGFQYEDQWYPSERRGARWVIVAEPIFYVHREYRTGRSYRNDHSYRDRYDRYDRRGDRRYDRYERRGDRRSDRRYSRHDRYRRDSRGY